MTLTADSKKRVVLPGAAPGDVFACKQKGPELILRRVHRAAPLKKKTKADVLKAIRNWKSIPNIHWEELRKLTREQCVSVKRFVFSAEGAALISEPGTASQVS